MVLEFGRKFLGPRRKIIFRQCGKGEPRRENGRLTFAPAVQAGHPPAPTYPGPTCAREPQRPRPVCWGMVAPRMPPKVFARLAAQLGGHGAFLFLPEFIAFLDALFVFASYSSRAFTGASMPSKGSSAGSIELAKTPYNDNNPARDRVKLVVVARAQATVSPIIPRQTTSIRSSMMSWILLTKRRPSVRYPGRRANACPRCPAANPRRSAV